MMQDDARATRRTRGELGQSPLGRISNSLRGKLPLRREANFSLRGEWLLRSLVFLGPIYIKAGQILATRADLLPPDLVVALKTLQDDVAPMSAAELHDVLTESGLMLQESFATFDISPIASASIAQVHRAVLRDGRKVAVKVVKKGTRQRLRANLRSIRAACWLATKIIPALAKMDLLERLDELGAVLIEQADMRREAENQHTIREHFTNHPFVSVPAVFSEYTSANILVSEFVEGWRGRDFRKIPVAGARLAARLQDSIYTMLYMNGVCHGDPHPGNIFFSETGQIVFVDFGMTVYLSEDEKWGLSSFYYACVRKEWENAAHRFVKHFVKGGCGPSDELLSRSFFEELVTILRLHFDSKRCRWSTISYFNDINAVLRRYGLRYTVVFTKVELIFLSCEGFSVELDPSIDIWANARKFTDRFSPYMSDDVRTRFDEYFRIKTPTSWRLRREAETNLIAPTHLDRYFFPSAYPLFIRFAKGCELIDADGNSYIDLAGGYGPHILGYNHPVSSDAIISAVQAGGINAFANASELDLANLIADALPSAERVVISNSGTEAVLHAIRVCRGFRRRDRVAKFEGHYHGFSDQGMVSSWFRFSGPREKPRPIHGSLGTQNGVVAETLVLQFGAPQSLDQIRECSDELACVIIEPMPATLARIDTEYLGSLRQVCDEEGIPLVFDEVVSGFRVDYGGVQKLCGIIPDVTCLGKIIGGGLPCGAIAGRADIINVAKTSGDPFLDYETKTFLGGTMSGNSISTAAGAAVLRHLRDNLHLYDELREKTIWLRDGLATVAKKAGVACQVKACGSIFSLTFSHRGSKYYRDKMAGSNFKANVALAYYMRKHGVYIPELHTMLLSMAHERQHLESIVLAFQKSLVEMTTDGFFMS